MDKDGRDVRDEVRVVSGDLEVRVPVLGLAPCPRIEPVSPTVDFGHVTVGRKVQRRLRIASLGQAGSRWRLRWDSELPLTFSPSEGELPANPVAAGLNLNEAVTPAQQRRVRSSAPTDEVVVTLDADRVDVFRALATLEVEGSRAPPIAVDVSASVLAHSLEVVWPEGKGQVDEVAFEPVMVGRERTLKLLVVNNGPEEASFRVAVDKQFRRRKPGEAEVFDPAEGLVQGGDGGGAGAGAGASAGAGAGAGGAVSLGPGQRDVIVTPDEATVPSLGQQELLVTFRPVERKKPVPYKAQARKVLGLS